MSKKILTLIYEYILWTLSYFIKKDKNIWVFGSMQGTKYLDNARYLFEFIHNFTDIKAVWISKDKAIVKQLKLQGFNAVYEYSYDAFHYASKTTIAIITHRGNREKADLPFYLFSKKTNIIQLWHGIGLKKSAFDDKIFSFTPNEKTIKWRVKRKLKEILFPFLNYVNEPSLILSLSKETQNIFTKAFRVSKDKVLITGYPRNDILLRNMPFTDNSEQKRIIYMPTFRGYINSDFDFFIQYKFDIKKFDKFLSQKNMKLDIKLHPFNKPSLDLIEKLKQSTNIFLLEHDAIYEILDQYSILITDYSSVYFDYILLERPIIFAPFDKEIYLKQDREFNFNYDEVTPGPKAMDWEEIIDCLSLFCKDSTLYSNERKIFKNRFHQYQDKNSTKRVYNAILNIVNESN